MLLQCKCRHVATAPSGVMPSFVQCKDSMRELCERGSGVTHKTHTFDVDIDSINPTICMCLVNLILSKPSRGGTEESMFL